MADQNDITLKQCLLDARGDAAKMTTCQNAYAAAIGGVTPKGGKVFVKPNGDATFVTTSGMVFLGGKVF